jgi:hypothetical protein
MQPWQIKSLEPEVSVLKFLDKVIAEDNFYIFARPKSEPK